MTSTLTRSKQPVRRRRRVALLVAALVILTLGALAWLTPVLGVRQVEVTGTEELAVDEVQAAAAVATGTPMLRVDVGGATGRVEELALVRSATVTRDWPWTVRIDVTERAVAAVMASGEQWRAFDVDGVEFARIADAADSVPRLDPGRQGASARTVAAMLELFAAMPAPTQAEVQRMNPVGENDLRMLIAGAEVRFGSSAEAGEKVRVLAALRQAAPGAAVYDVSAPDAPAAR
jgi:cell division protein FtsQ